MICLTSKSGTNWTLFWPWTSTSSSYCASVLHFLHATLSAKFWTFKSLHRNFLFLGLKLQRLKSATVIASHFHILATSNYSKFSNRVAAWYFSSRNDTYFMLGWGDEVRIESFNNLSDPKRPAFSETLSQFTLFLIHKDKGMLAWEIKQDCENCRYRYLQSKLSNGLSVISWGFHDISQVFFNTYKKCI